MSVPRLSVGLAVYNGERYLAEALDSILSQTFTDFELIISDNASNDNTERICREYAAKDSRIRYYRNAINIGGANNENRTFELARGEYFRWAADDDVCAPDLFAKCIEVLDQDPEVVLCHSIVDEIDEHGRPLRTLDRNKASSTKPYERFRSLTSLDYNCEETYGIIRSEVLRNTRLQPNYTDSDRTLLAELGLHGRFYQVPEPLFYRRIHPGMSTMVFSDWRERMTWFNPSLDEDSIVLPNWQQFFHYLLIIAESPLNLYEKIRCYLRMLSWLCSEWHGRWMVRDLLLAIMKAYRRLIRRRLRSNQFVTAKRRSQKN
jgi:glycosyltransferase involved in cell wall biosynthesis